MKLVATEEERDLAAMLRGLLATHCPTELVRGLREPGADRFPKRLWDALAEAGVLGLPFAEEHDGAGGSLTDLGIFAREAGRALCPSVVLSTVALGLALDLLGDDEHRARHLPSLCRGETRGTVLVASAWDCSDLAPTLTAAPTGDGRRRVSGSVGYVVDADLADLVLVTAADADGATVGLLVRPGEAARVEQLTTTAGDRYSRLHLDDAVVAADDVLAGPAGRGLAVDDLRRVAHQVRSLQCLEMVGGAEAVLERTVAYTRGREQFGRPIASFQAAQHLVADMHIAVQAGRLAAQSAVHRLAGGHVATRETAVAVMHAAQAYRRATLDAHQLHGGMGYVLETDLHLWSERARELGVLGGGPDVAARWLEQEVGLA